MRLAHLRSVQTATILTAAICILCNTGCVGLVAQMLYVVQGNEQPAECELLEDKTVAVVCVSQSGDYGPDNSAQRIARYTSKILAVKVDGIKVIHHGKVNDWLDNNEEGATNFRKIGKDLDADMVLAIEISDYSLHEGQTMYKGRAGIQLNLHDMSKGGDIVWEDTNYEFTYPVNSGVHISSINQAKFEKSFLGEISVLVARHFHSYEAISNFASDVRAHNLQ